jgi:hypothetical protein
MPTFKLKVDKAGNFYTKEVYNPKNPDIFCGLTKDVKLKGKLLKPKDASVTATLSINKKTLKFEASTGKAVTVGPFPMNACDNTIEFEEIGQTR